MCQCTPEIRTPYCGKGDCVWPNSKPEGTRPVHPWDQLEQDRHPWEKNYEVKQCKHCGEHPDYCEC